MAETGAQNQMKLQYYVSDHALKADVLLEERCHTLVGGKMDTGQNHSYYVGNV